MTLKKFRAYFILDSKIYFQEPTVIFFALIFPAVMYTAFGFMFGNETYGASNVGYYDQYTGSFMGIILLNTALFNIGPSLVVYKELGFFRRLMITPLSINAIVVSTLAKAFIIFLLGMIEISIIGWLMFDRLIPEHVFQLFLGLLISAICLFSFGFMLGSLFKKSNSAFSGSILIFQPMLFLSGATIPLDTFSPLIRSLTYIVPMSHVVKLIRLSWNGQLFTSAAVTPVILCFVLATICIVISNKTFRNSAI